MQVIILKFGRSLHFSKQQKGLYRLKRVKNSLSIPSCPRGRTPKMVKHFFYNIYIIKLYYIFIIIFLIRILWSFLQKFKADENKVLFMKQPVSLRSKFICVVLAQHCLNKSLWFSTDRNGIKINDLVLDINDC